MRALTLWLFGVVAVLVSSLPARATGGFDAGFGNGGLLLAPLDHDSQPRAITLIQGLPLLVGRAWGASVADASLQLFDDNGVMGEDQRFTLGAASAGFSDVVVAPDGTVFACGFVFSGEGSALRTDALVVRFSDFGFFDVGFGQDGMVMLDGVGEDDECYGMAIDDDGSIMVAGRTKLPVQNGVVPARAALWRLLSDGTRDTAFANNGHLLIDPVMGQDMEADTLAAVTSVGDDVMVVGSAIYDAGGRSSVIAMRIADDGSLVNSFGGDGVVVYDPGLFLASVGVSVHQSGGHFLIGAIADDGAEVPDLDLSVVRISENGALDQGYGDNGVVRVSVHTLRGVAEPSPDFLRAVVPYDSGAAVLVGSSEGQFVAVRITPTGVVDIDFGDDGLLRADVCGPSGAVADAVRDGDRLWIAGACFLDPFFADTVLARLNVTDEQDPGEGEGEEGEGEEGEGEEGEGEGVGQEGEGEVSTEPAIERPASCGCTSTRGAAADMAALVPLLVWLRRRGRRL